MTKKRYSMKWMAGFLLVFFWLGLSPVNIQPALAEPVSQIELNSPDHAPVNVNSATAEELTRIQGIGPSIAARIVEFRELEGPFSSPEDLAMVKGIGGVKLQKIKGQITV